ncbi:8174_t:CDS:2 [Racocetra fulgida]|uniref:8174_t:CDS:1 n=1 Tax=Racocetra fulgida TaxID=60492 RepID=A0A9N9FXY7_9GLOM|nr:8174_t:CDS:2 [Racocetra fulgida]
MYEEQIRGKNRLIEELEYVLKKSEKDCRRKRSEIERIEIQVKAQKRTIDELVGQQRIQVASTNHVAESNTSQKVSFEMSENHVPHDLLGQLRQKDYIIDNLTRRVEKIEAAMKDKDYQIEVLTKCLTDEKKTVREIRRIN